MGPIGGVHSINENSTCFAVHKSSTRSDVNCRTNHGFSRVNADIANYVGSGYIGHIPRSPW